MQHTCGYCGWPTRVTLDCFMPRHLKWLHVQTSIGNRCRRQLQPQSRGLGLKAHEPFDLNPVPRLPRIEQLFHLPGFRAVELKQNDR